jgi:uncharacterized protein (DUF2252 family)
MNDSKNVTDDSQVSLLTDWQDFLSEQTPVKDRIASGKQMRDLCSRSVHGQWKPSKERVNPIDLLMSQDQTRLENLVPLKYGRMMQSPFAFFRGSSLIMASDLSCVPRTQLTVQLCGDCHLSNFGIFATPERNIIFDLNDFDETLPGPFEWDLKRLAASFAIAANNSGFTDIVEERCVAALARVYRRKMEEFSQMNTLEVWYHRVDWEYLIQRIEKPGRKKTVFSNLAKLKEKRSQAGALAKLTEIVDGKRRIKDQPPYIFHAEIATQEATKALLNSYAKSLWSSRQRLLQRYHFVDVAAKVVGVGSVGAAAGIVLLQGESGPDDHIFLQIKEANASVLERYLGRSEFEHPGNRVVNGQRLLQAASDMFLGWTSGPKRDFYVRQLMDVKASVPVDELDAVTLEQYAEVCGYALARAHARAGDPAQIFGYLGRGETFDEALSKFALAYTKQNAQDHDALLKAIKNGKVVAAPGK